MLEVNISIVIAGLGRQSILLEEGGMRGHSERKRRCCSNGYARQ
jgi:hypothetical protein